MAKFKYKSRKEISSFLAGIDEAVSVILDKDTSSQATLAAQRTGPHLTMHLAAASDAELTEAGIGAGEEWEVEDLVRHLVRVTIAKSFCGASFRLPGYEQYTIELIDRYKGGDYSYTADEVSANKRSEELRTINHVPEDESNAIPDLIKGIVDLVSELTKGGFKLQVLNEEQMVDLLKEKLKKEADEEEEQENPEEGK